MNVVIWTLLFIFVAFPDVLDQVERSHNADLIAVALNFRSYIHPTVTFRSDISCHRSNVAVHPVCPQSLLHLCCLLTHIYGSRCSVTTKTESRYVVYVKFVSASFLVSSLTLKPVWWK
jgi:hypothetical protein